MKYIVLSFLFCLLAFSLNAQKKQTTEQTFLDAEYFRLYEEYEEALPLYQRLIRQGYDNAHINYRIGECLLNIAGRKQNAIPHLEKATSSISRKFKEGQLKETNAPVYAIFYLGRAYQVNNELDKALSTYNDFIDQLEDKDQYNMDYVHKQINSCRTAKKLMSHPIHVDQKNLGQTINSPNANNRPIVNNDETKIVYISELKFYDAVYMAEKNDQNEWKAPMNLTPQIQSEGNLYSSSLDKDGDKMALFKSNPYNGDIYVTEYDKENDRWKTPEKLGKNINSRYWETHACFCDDEEKRLYFTSNRKGGIGGIDIYYSEYNEEKQEWGPAQNLGPQINTPYNEETPFMTKDGKRLYFSSQGHDGMGGFDIFYTERIGENEWSEPVNIGYPINTTDDDLFFCPVQNGHAGYIAKYGKDGYGNQDIYRVEIYSKDNPKEIELQGYIEVPAKKKLNEQITVTIDSLQGKNLKTLVFKDIPNEITFTQTLTPGSYKIQVQGEGYEALTKNISLGWDYNRDTYELRSELTAKEEKIHFVTIKNIYFEFDEHALSQADKTRLDTLVNLMKEDPKLEVEIIGHTDAKGSPAYNKKLSLKRARTVIDYLSQQGIDPNRLSEKARGEKYPIALNTFQDGEDCPQGRRFNRRVEIRPTAAANKFIISQFNNVPNQLRKETNNTFSVLLFEKDQPLPKNYFDQFPSLKPYSIKEYYNGRYIYVMGRMKDQSKAVEPYQKAVEAGFREARIISNYQLEDILNLDLTRYNNNATSGKQPIYTIQIKAAKNEIPLSYFSNVENVEEKLGDDGFFRYICGRFYSYAAAKEKWKELVEKGYSDAFIMNYERYK